MSPAVRAVSLSAPTTNMPWTWIPWRCRAAIALVMSSTVCDFA